MNKANKSIGWTDYTWNPIKGICPVGCWYCYARRIYERFKKDKYITLHPKELEKPYSIKKKSKIFVCSTIELFHPAISDKWRNVIFRVIKDNPQHTFQILTKFPQNIDREMPDNVWLGCTITGDDNQWKKGFDLFMAKSKIRFISFEPLLKPIAIIEELYNFDWIIIGRLTGYGKKYQPEKEWIQEIVDECQYTRFKSTGGIPVFLKDNLKDIWGENLIQEFPQ